MTGYHKQNEACNVAMFCRGVSAPAGLSHGPGGGWKANKKQGGGGGGQRGQAWGAEGAGATALCPQLLLMSLGFVFTL